MKFLVSISGLIVCSSVIAGDYKSIECSSLGEIANTCTECFDAGEVKSDYGRVPLFNEFKNFTDHKIVILEKENKNPVIFEALGSVYKWTYSKIPLFKFSVAFNTPSDSLKKQFPQLENSTFYTFPKNTSTRYIETDADAGIFVQKISEKKSDSNSQFVIRYIVNYRDYFENNSNANENKLGNISRLESCSFFKPSLNP